MQNSFPVINPFDGSIVGHAPAYTRQDVVQAIESAKQYDQSLSAQARSKILQSTAKAIGNKKEAYAKLITLESGLALQDSLHEVSRAINVLKYASEACKRLPSEIETYDFQENGQNCNVKIIREPVGVVGCITPFNHPLNQVVHKVAPAIAANNACILKPSEQTPLTAIKLIEELRSNGLPDEILHVVTGEVEEVCPPILSSDVIGMISFTGSTSVGQLITRQAGIKKLSLELGGNDAILVMPDVEIISAAKIVASGAFKNSGQRCSAIKRVLVHEHIISDFLDALIEVSNIYKIGNPMMKDTVVGTLIHVEAAKVVESRIKSAVKDGARLLYGGHRKDAFIHPTILSDVSLSSELTRLETFGPVAPVLSISSLDQAIELINDTPFGLNAAIITNDTEVQKRFFASVNVGGVRINLPPGFRSENVPFGGNKMSGFGRSGVWPSVLEMTNQKSIIPLNQK